MYKIKLNKVIVLWDVENIPFKFHHHLKLQFQLKFGYNFSFKRIAISKKNISIFNNIGKKRGFKLLLSDNITDGADKQLIEFLKEHNNSEVLVVSGDKALINSVKNICSNKVYTANYYDDSDFKLIRKWFFDSDSPYAKVQRKFRFNYFKTPYAKNLILV